MKQSVIRPIRDDDRARLREFFGKRWGADLVVCHGKKYVPSRLPGFVAEVEQQLAGVVTYSVAESDCELVTLDSVIEAQGVGSALIAQVEQDARRCGLERLWLITTNDNIDALRFYQRRGFRIVRVDVNAVTRARTIKPEIPLLAENGIVIADELELEKRLRAD